MIDKRKLNKALRTWDKKYLKQPYKDRWTKKRPTTGYCIIVSLLVLHYLAPHGSKLYCLKLDDGERHYYVKTPDGKRIDYTKNQYDHEICYKGERASHLKFKSFMPKVQELASLLGLELKTK